MLDKWLGCVKAGDIVTVTGVMIVFTLFLWNVIIFSKESFVRNSISRLVLEGYDEKSY